VPKIDYPLTWEIGDRSLVLNGHRTPDGGIDTTKLDRTYQIEAFDFSPLDIREQREGFHLLTGGDFGPANRMFRHISIRGVIKAPRAAVLEDMEAELLSAFDLERAQLDAPTTFGEGKLIYYSPTEYSGVHIGSIVREGFYCRPENYPITYDRRGVRALARRFAVQLVAGYPYRVLWPAESIVFSSGDWSKTLYNWALRNGGISRVTFTIVTSGNGDTDFTISDGTRDLVLDLSGFATGTLIVEMATKQIYRIDLAPRAAFRTSGIDSFFDIPAGGADVVISNTTNITSVTAAYHQTRS